MSNYASSDDETEPFHDGDEFEYAAASIGIVFLIDGRSSMFEKCVINEDQKLTSKFNLAMAACRHVVLKRIRTYKKELIGVVFFGTDEPDSKTDTKHVSLFMDLHYPGAETVKKLDCVLRAEDRLIKDIYGCSTDFLLADALWYCSSLFTKSGVNLDKKRILLFTDDCDPHASNPDHAHMARKRAKDLNQVRISLELLPLGLPILADFEYFQYSSFYKELVETVNGTDDDEEIEPSRSLEELVEKIKGYDFKARRFCKIKFSLGNGAVAGLSLYSLYKEQKLQGVQPVHRATNEPLSALRRLTDQITGEMVFHSDVENCVSIAGELIPFTHEEKARLKNLMQPGLTLLGFKPASWLSERVHCGKSSFAYPDESLIKGSSLLVKTLVERCVLKEKVALCVMRPREQSTTRYVCLQPCPETTGEDGSFSLPCGFHIIPLPFYNDIREQTFKKSPEVPDTTLAIAKEIVNKLKFSYTPSNFNNPVLSKVLDHLQALALDYVPPISIADSTMPNEEEQSARVEQLALEFKKACRLKRMSEKRPNKEGPQKVVKKYKASDTDELFQDITNAIPLKGVERFTAIQLKEFLKHHKQTVSNKKKDDLVNAVYQLNLQ